MNKSSISISVIKRLPRYYRFLENLKNNGISRISSSELSDRMGLTASQIRHDFNCFGGFGQQGYGYNVPELHAKIGEIANKIFQRQSGFKLIGIFDKNEAMSGKMIHQIPVRHIDYIENFCIDNSPTCAVICIPAGDMKELTDLLCRLGIKSFWNFSNYDIALAHPEVLVESVHLTDSLMALSYLSNNEEGQK